MTGRLALRSRGRAARLPRPLPLVAAVVFAIGATSFMRSAMLPDIGRDLVLSSAEIGLITTAYALGRLFADLPAGRVADRVSPAVSLTGAGLMLAIGSAATAAAESFAVMLAAVAAVGVASAVGNTTGMATFTTHAPSHRRGAAMAVFSTALMTGQMVGPAVGGVLAGLASWRVALAVGALVGVAVAVGCLRSRRSVTRAGAGPGAAPPPDEGAGTPAPAPRVVAARTRDLGWAERAALASVAFAVFFVLGELPQTLIPVIGADELGLSVSLVGAGLAVAGLSRLIGAVIAGMVSDRVSRKAALIPSMIAMGASVAVLAFPPTRASWLVALALLSLASSGVSVAATIIGDRVPREIVGRRMGSFRVAGDFGLLVGPAAGGLLYQHAGRPAAVLLGAAVLVASGLACAVVVAEPRTVA